MPRFTVLGTLEATDGARVCRPRPPKLLQLFALLALRPGRALPVESIFAELWGEHPPRRAASAVQTYVYQLRRALELDLPSASGLLVTRPYGYLLQIEPGQVDAFEFEELTRRGADHLDGGRSEEAASCLRRALNLWTGPALPGTAHGPLLLTHAARLEERWLRATELRLLADLLLGREREVIGDLRALTLSHPLNEWFHTRLVEALGRAGRRDEALTAYERVRVILRDELGLDPSPELRGVHRALLDPPSSAELPAPPWKTPGQSGFSQPSSAIRTPA